MTNGMRQLVAGTWTKAKLEILERYLDAYTTVLKNSSFQLLYIDAFAVKGSHPHRTMHIHNKDAVARMLPTSTAPVNPGDLPCADKLNIVFGDNSWKSLYTIGAQQSLFGDEVSMRESGTENILSIYKGKLSNLFGDRFPNLSRTLMNSKNSPLFEFIFCVGSPGPNAIGVASKIARHLVDRF